MFSLTFIGHHVIIRMTLETKKAVANLKQSNHPFYRIIPKAYL